MEEYKKVTISFTKNQLDKLDEIMKREQGYSRSSLVREEVDNYLGYRAQKENVNYLSPIISQNIKLVLSRFEENLSELLIKLAVEVSKSNILSAREPVFSRESLSALFVKLIVTFLYSSIVSSIIFSCSHKRRKYRGLPQ